MTEWLNLFARGCDDRFIPQKDRHSAAKCCMSALGQKQTFSHVCAMSALPPKADIAEQLKRNTMDAKSLKRT